jgi:hypothetical protein
MDIEFQRIAFLTLPSRVTLVQIRKLITFAGIEHALILTIWN